MKKILIKIMLFICLVGWASCENFVSIEPKGQLIPSTVQDFRRLLDYVQAMNFTGNLGDLASDDIFIPDLIYQRLNPYERNTYIWNSTIYSSQDQALDWNTPYERIYTANLILEGLKKTETGTQEMRNTLKGEALFHRALAHYEVASLYAKAYDPATAEEDLGIPLRLKSDVFAVSTRPSLKRTYDQILHDLTEAVELLPPKAEVATRASKAAAYGLLARIYLDMGMYEKALENAENCLAIQPNLMNYNNLPPVPFGVFKELNEETLFFTMLPFSGYGEWSRRFRPSEEMYDLYESNDLRETLFFSTYIINGRTFPVLSRSYGGRWNRFTGLATDEVYLIAAECSARTGQLDDAVDYLNDLLVNRYKTGTYTPFTSNDKMEIIKKVIEERRKELVGRGRRWFDLKRYNKEPELAVTLKRTVGGTTYTLPPGDNRWVFPIPKTVIQATGMEQNPR